MTVLRVGVEVERLGALALEEGELDMVGEEVELVQAGHGCRRVPVPSVYSLKGKDGNKESGFDANCATPTLDDAVLLSIWTAKHDSDVDRADVLKIWGSGGVHAGDA